MNHLRQRDRLATRWPVAAAICLAAGVLAAGVPCGELLAVPPASLPEMLEDAELNDVRFVDAQRGWAVGDRGVIWHTADGGRSWQLQDSPVSCRLESLCFVDAMNGWIVGGWVHPYTHESTGVVLHTRDGGRRWTLYSDLTLPALKQVRFFDDRQGWAVGCRSSLYRSGVFRTQDGGRSWAAVPGGSSEGWLAADFHNERTGAVAGRSGALGLVAYNQMKPSQTPDLGIRHLRRLRLAGPTGGWLVGDGGLLLRTTDGGFTWQAPEGRLPAGLGNQFDFRALEVHQRHCWAAGSPGTRVVHSADGGRSWEVYSTEQPVPLNALCFLDDQQGWACGPLGTILATRDGGRTWQRQRTGGTRAALLGIFSESQRVPLELLAHQCGDEGYLGLIEILNRRDLELPSSASTSDEERLHRAVVSAGGSAAGTAWRFPLRQRGLEWSAQSIMAGWDLFSDGQGVNLLEEHVVRKIRQWRPDVIVTEATSPRGDHPLAHLTNQLVLSAVQKAADPTAYVDQLTLAGLKPWTVRKVFSHAVGDDSATNTIHSSQLATRLGHALADQTAYGYGLLDAQYRPAISHHGFRLLLNRLPQEVGQQGIFHGIALQSGGEARRQRLPIPNVNLAELSRRAQKSRNVHQLLNRVQGGPADVGWLSQVHDLTSGLSRASGGEVLFQLAERYRQKAQPELAAEAYERLVDQYPDHDLAEPALVWLIQFHASREAAWQLRRGNQGQTAQLAVQARLEPPIPGGVQQASFHEPLTGPLPATLPGPPTDPRSGAPPGAFPGSTARPLPAAVAGQAGIVSPDSRLQDRFTRAIELGRRIERSRPALFATPQVRFPLSNAYRERGMPREAERFFQTLAGNPESDAWVRSAEAELWLGTAHGAPPKPIWTCVATSEKPHLDGVLDDAIWRQARPQPLRSPQQDDAEWPAGVLLAHDTEYLYLAATCRKVAGLNYAFEPAARPRDPDLQQRDRISIFLDVDRDYATYYRLTIDHRGWTGEACLGDAAWNPQWFVAATDDAEQWTIEAAIAWTELVPAPPGRRQAWAVGAQRVVPGVGVQSFTQPAAIEPRPETFGLLIFD